MTEMKKILVIGSGAREHAMVCALSRSSHTVAVYCFSSSVNPGIRDLVHGYEVGDILDVDGVVTFATVHAIDMVVVGPEAPLEKGIADALELAGVVTIGPKRRLAQLETSKGFTRQLLEAYQIPGNPMFQRFSSLEGVEALLRTWDQNYVIKSDGLMGGKGVKVYGDHLFTLEESLFYCQELLRNGYDFVIEEKVVGQEFSLISFCDGGHLVHTPIIQDHKRAFDNDQGPNTGGMGTYTDAHHLLPFISAEDVRQAQAINEQVIGALYHKYGHPYKGFLYGGFMATAQGVKLIEYNVRLGDPEAMNLLTLLETDFVDVLQAIVEGTLTHVDVRFAHQATVCKYLVPKGYPDNPLKAEEVHIGEVSKGVPVFLGAVDIKNDVMIATGSRTLAVVGMAPTIGEAERIAQAEIEKIPGNFTYRQDIGTMQLINVRIDHMNSLRGENTYKKLEG